MLKKPSWRSLVSIYSITAWPAVIWTSCILAVLLLGTRKAWSQKVKHFPPSDPKKPIVLIFISLAFFRTWTMFSEFPEVDNAKRVSSGLARVCRFLLNKTSGSKSLIAAVNVEESCNNEIAGIPSLLTSEVSLIKNSAVKCWASAAEPPLPHIKTLFPFFKVSKILTFSIFKAIGSNFFIFF